MATLISALPISFGIIDHKTELPIGWAFREASDEFLKAIAPDGAEYLWDGGENLTPLVDGLVSGDPIKVPR